MMILEVAMSINIDKSFDYISDENVEVGCRVVVPFGNKKLIGFVVGIKQKQEMSLKKIVKIVDKVPLVNEELLKLANWISNYYLCSVGVALNAVLPSANKIPAKKTDTTNQSYSSSSQTSIVPTTEQQNIIDKISLAIGTPNQKTFLLFGQNDSGKTEVYIRAIEVCLKNNYSAIYLVPDISLTSQFGELLNSNFGSVVGVWHSGLSQKEKNQFLLRLVSGEIRVVLGSRSAVFLPVHNPKLFIIDEEDDDFYKNNRSPKYHTRDVAIERAKITNSVVVLGSATPSVETYHKTKTGEIEILKLTERINKRPLPKISVINLKYINPVSWRAITKPLKYAMTNALLQKKQVFLFVV